MIPCARKFFVPYIIALLANSVFFIPLYAADDDQVYLNAQGMLRRASYSTGSSRETFALMNRDNFRHLVTGNEEQFVQVRYDENSHIINRTVWNITKGEATRESREEYFYTPEGGRQERRIKTDFVAREQEETLFNSKGLESRITLYALASDIGAAKGNQISRRDLHYDAQDRLIEEIYRSRIPDPAETGAETESETETVEISRFTYTGRSKKPNTELYRDDVMVHKTEYTAENDFIETFFFEGDFSAVVTFENGEKKQERFFFNGEEIKRNI